MIKITKGNGVNAKVLQVSQSAYENFFQRQGYVQVETSPHPSPLPEGEGTKSDDDLFLESVEAKPISQWSVEELRRYAVLVGLETADGRRQTAAELRTAIKAVIDGKAAEGGQQTDEENNGND